MSADPDEQGTNHLRLGYNSFPHLALLCSLGQDKKNLSDFIDYMCCQILWFSDPPWHNTSGTTPLDLHHHRQNSTNASNGFYRKTNR
eukprot:c29379_g3_i1 orf=1-258(-)